MIHKQTQNRVSAYVAPVGLLVVWLLLSVTTTSAQSGSIGTTPSPVAPLQPASSTISSAKPSADANGDRYKLVFLTGYERNLNYNMGKEKDSKLYGRDRAAAFNSFIEELNIYGSQNYKVEFVSDDEAPFAILKAADKPYEYAWVGTGADVSFKAEFGSGSRYAALAEKGFHLFQHDYFDVACGTESGECTFFENSFLEREKGDERPVRYRLVWKQPIGFWGKGKLTRDLLKQTQAGLSAGLYPVQALDNTTMLLESPPNGQTPATNWQDLQLARNTDIWGFGRADNLPQQVNKLAAQGYRLTLVGPGLAVMNRPTGPATPVSYVWVDTYKKDVAKEVAELQDKGAIFQAVYQYSNEFGIFPQLIFEQPTVSDGKQREYKLLKINLYLTMPATATSERVQSHIVLAPDSKDTEKQLNDLARAGFVVRGLFTYDGFNILLERIK